MLSRVVTERGGIGLRRNGKEKACEPCRKGKLACDHTTPICNRCIRRKITAKCIYHPAPMTRPRDSQASTSPSINQHAPSFSLNASSQQSSPQQRISIHSQPPYSRSDPLSQGSGLPRDAQTNTTELNRPTNRIVASSPSYDWDHDTAFRRSVRYYGPTSFSAAFTEGAELSADLNIYENARKHPANWIFGQPLLGRERPSAPTVRMNQIVKALFNIPSKEICERLLGTFSSLHHFLMNPVVLRHCVETLWSTFGAELAEPRTPEKLSLIADVLFQNEGKPLPPPPEDGMEWLDGFMGPNMRFEMLGMLFCFCGMAYQTLQDWDVLFQDPKNHGRDRKQASWRMKECADICLKMCEISEENNEISIALMLCSMILESVCTGDESFQLRRRHGDMSVCAITAGLHRLPFHESNKVTAASEWKVRLFSVMYATDKNQASLNGTPPMLSARYCTIRLPLDISCEDLFLPQPELAKLVTGLDINGWDGPEKVHRATFHRALQILSELREEILEVSLGVDVSLSVEKIDELYQRCQDVYNNLPDKIHYYAHDITPKQNVPGRVFVSQAYLLLNSLQSKLLIDRIAVTRGLSSAQRLLNTAMELMDLTNMFWIKRDQLMSFCSAFEWIFTCYGVPAAGVMCVELLKQATGQSFLQFSRSDAIQKLTMFIGFLEWIRPTDGNYLLAGRLKKVVRKILDRVLDPPPQIPNGSDMMGFQIDPMLEPFGEMDWLWTQNTNWMEFN